MNFQEQLQQYIIFAFDNEQDFLKHFYPEIESPSEYGLDSFYMASERCHVTIKSNLVGTYLVAKDTIKTLEYLDWYAAYVNINKE